MSKSDLEVGDVVLIRDSGWGFLPEDEGKYVEVVGSDSEGYLEVKPYDKQLQYWPQGFSVNAESFGTNPMVLLNVHNDVDTSTHIKIEVLTAEFNYQGLYKGTVIDNAKVVPDGYSVEFKHNGKNWILNEGDYLVFKDEEHAKSESKSALDKQVSGSHYKTCGIQPIEYIHANELNYFQGNVVKYVTRYKDKAGKADLEKAIHYLELMIELEYKEEN